MGGKFSLIRYKDRALHKSFEAAGLESRMINTSNGSTIHCWVPKGLDSSSAATEKKPVLVMLHGFGASAVWQWEPQIKALLPNFTLVIPDLVFFGLSTTTSKERTETFQAECIWQVLESLGVRKFSLVGTSYGGFVSYRLAQIHEDAVDKIILSNSSICMVPEDDQALCARGGTTTITDLLLPTTPAGLDTIGRLVSSKPASPWPVPTFIKKDYLNVLYLGNRDQKVEMLKDLAFGKAHGPALLTKVNKDILIIWGENDNVFLPEQAERMKNYFGDKAKLVVLKDAGHISQLEQSARWNALVQSFLLGKELVY